MISRNIPLLAGSQVLAVSGMGGVVLLGGLIGAELAPAPDLATLPLSLAVVGTALATIPAAFLMQRIGRRRGFMAGTALACLAAYAVARADFVLFCAATLLIGVNGAFVQQYRFGATESVPPEQAGRAVSFVLIGGIAAGFLGPDIARRTGNLLPVAYSGSFVSLGVLYAVAIVLLAWLRDVTPVAESNETAGKAQPLQRIARRPTFVVAVLAGAVGFGVMSFIMTARRCTCISTPASACRRPPGSSRATSWRCSCRRCSAASCSNGWAWCG